MFRHIRNLWRKRTIRIPVYDVDTGRYIDDVTITPLDKGEPVACEGMQLVPCWFNGVELHPGYTEYVETPNGIVEFVYYGLAPDGDMITTLKLVEV